MDRTKEATAEMKEKLDAMKAELAPAGRRAGVGGIDHR